jgi:D-aminopeptidase
VLPGASMEPQRMHKRDGSRPFDRFSRTKAIQKATRNALAAFIPEEIEQAVLAVASKQPDRVLRIQTEAEAKVADLPPALDDDEARALIAQAERVYDEVRELGRWPGEGGDAAGAVRGVQAERAALA